MPAKTSKPTKPTKRKAQPPATSSSNGSGAKRTALGSQDVVRAIDRAMRTHDALTKAVQKQVDAYQTATAAVLETFTSTLRHADEDIEDRQRRLDELQDKIDYQTRQGKIQVDQDLAEYGLQEARKLASKHAMTIIDLNELGQLRNDLSRERQSHDDEVKKAVHEAVGKEKAIHNSIQARIKADCALELAQTKAQLESKDAIIKSLTERIAKNEDDIREARNLTRQVAESTSRAAINVHTANGK